MSRQVIIQINFMFQCILLISARISSKKVRDLPLVFNDCQVISVSAHEFKEISISPTECRSLSPYTYALGSNSNFIAEVYSYNNPSKLIKTVRNPFSLIALVN